MGVLLLLVVVGKVEVLEEDDDELVEDGLLGVDVFDFDGVEDDELD